MGDTKLQKTVFNLLMCALMVTGMSSYNLLLEIGLSDSFIQHLLGQIVLVFFVALFFEMLVVGPLVRTLVFKVLKASSRMKPMKQTLVFSLFMVLGMVTCMSTFGSVMRFGFTVEAIQIYPLVFLRNLIMALPFNLLIVSPLVRFVLFPAFFPAFAKRPNPQTK